MTNDKPNRHVPTPPKEPAVVPARGLLAKFDSNSKMRRASKARTRYLTSTGHIIKGNELFLKREVPIQVMAIQPSQLERMRKMTIQQRVKLFDPKKAWNPGALSAGHDEPVQVTEELPELPPLEEEGHDEDQR